MIQFYKQEGVQWASPVKFRLQGGLLIFCDFYNAKYWHVVPSVIIIFSVEIKSILYAFITPTPYLPTHTMCRWHCCWKWYNPIHLLTYDEKAEIWIPAEPRFVIMCVSCWVFVILFKMTYFSDCEFSKCNSLIVLNFVIYLFRIGVPKLLISDMLKL